MIALLYNLQIRILISGTSSGWGGITKFRQIFSDFDCECAQAFNFVPFFQLLIYTIGRRLKLRKTKTCPQQILYIVAAAAALGQISHYCEHFLAIHRVEYHCVNNLVRHKSSPSKGRLVRRSVFKDSAPPHRHLLIQPLTEWVRLAPWNIWALRWSTIVAKKFWIIWRRQKRVSTDGELLAQQWSICLPGNGVGGWRYWDGVRLVVWILVWGHSSLVKVRIQLRSDRRRWPGWVPNSI